ncbi:MULTISPECIES: caspase family protein [Leptolyngbya]|uniref:caspase family protein n=1 Tax=Leptolyngbya TaxID=47251 RepID=UPI001684FCA1|nr:caspase family protein [Leptolyngbya sp. FACHB-1624]MBD1854775.1 caspase family protein [Leptolyngbya sp. FACHB-1624]
MSFSDSEPRRYLIAIGSPTCENMGLSRLENVKRDLEQVTALFQDQGYQRILSDQIRIGATADKIKGALSSWFSSDERKASDCVVIYYAGHGDEGGRSKDHYLFTVESQKDDLCSTAIETRSLIKTFFPSNRQSPQNVLLILDVCYAGIGQRQSADVFGRLQGVAELGSGFWMIASSDSNTQAGDGAFVEALKAVLQTNCERFQGEGEFLSIDVLIEAINQHFAQTEQAQRAVASATEIQRQVIFLRNPQFSKRLSFPGSEQLLRLLDQFDPEQRYSAYRQCYQGWSDRTLPKTNEGLLLTLINLPQGIEQRLPEFVSLLIQNQSIQTELHQSLETWATKNLPNFATIQTQVQPIATEFYLMIYVNQSKQLKDRYTVK